MPNHVTTRITSYSVTIEAIIRDCVVDGEFDFNKLIPQPEGIFLGPLTAEDRDNNPINWYDWNCANWGTKWNAYNLVVGYDYIQFDTAWGIPKPVLDKIIEKYPSDMLIQYFDEGHNFWGSICVMEDGTQVSRDSIEADEAELCLLLKGYHPDED